MRRHPQAHRYRVAVKHKQIDVYEQWGPDARELTTMLYEGLGLPHVARAARMEDFVERTAQYTPLARFVLEDAATRTFKVERVFALGSGDEWMPVGWGSLADLAQTVIPTLGTDLFYDMLPWGSTP